MRKHITFAIVRKVSSTRDIVSGFGLYIIFCDDLLAFATSPKSPNSYSDEDTKQSIYAQALLPLLTAEPKFHN